MKLLFDFFPVLLFLIALYLFDPIIATGVAMVAALAQVAGYWFKNRRFEVIHIVVLVTVIIFGGLTLLFRDITFFKWKPTVVNWIFALIMIGSHWVGKKPAIQYIMGSQLELPEPVWRKVNLSWALFFIVLGIINLYVAFYFRIELDDDTRTKIWANFKVFGLMGLTFIFAIVQMAFLYKYLAIEEDSEEKS